MWTLWENCSYECDNNLNGRSKKLGNLLPSSSLSSYILIAERDSQNFVNRNPYINKHFFRKVKNMKNVLTTVTNKVKTSKLGLYASGALMGLASLAPVMAADPPTQTNIVNLLCGVAALAAFASGAILFVFALIELGNAKAENSPAAKHTAQQKFVAVLILVAIGIFLSTQSSIIAGLIPDASSLIKTT